MGKKVGKIAMGPLGIVGGALGLSAKDKEGEYVTPEEKARRDYQKAAGDYAGEMGLAEKGVQESALTRGLFGAGGLQEQLGREGQDLAGRGFQLSQEDREAYGQAAGDISRLFGQQEQQAAQSLARRGLASAGSGAAGATFSGLAGNKNEQLGRMQMQIANQRMENTRQRLFQNRQMQQDLGMSGANLAEQRRSGKLAGLAGAASAESALNDDRRQTLADRQGAKKLGLLNTIGQGLQRGIGQTAQQLPGMALGAATGGASMGAGMGGNPLAQKNKYGVDGAGGTTTYSTDYLNMK